MLGLFREKEETKGTQFLHLMTWPHGFVGSVGSHWVSFSIFSIFSQNLHNRFWRFTIWPIWPFFEWLFWHVTISADQLQNTATPLVDSNIPAPDQPITVCYDWFTSFSGLCQIAICLLTSGLSALSAFNWVASILRWSCVVWWQTVGHRVPSFPKKT